MVLYIAFLAVVLFSNHHALLVLTNPIQLEVLISSVYPAVREHAPRHFSFRLSFTNYWKAYKMQNILLALLELQNLNCMQRVKLRSKCELQWSVCKGYMPVWAALLFLFMLEINCDSMSFGALHFNGQQNLPSFRQFRVSAPQHLPQLSATQQKPSEADSWASVTHHATLCTPVMSHCLDGRKQG